MLFFRTFYSANNPEKILSSKNWHLKIINVSWAANPNIIMISERSCDTEDWSNDAENTALITEINYIWKYFHWKYIFPNILFLHILFVLHFLFYCTFYSLFLFFYLYIYICSCVVLLLYNSYFYSFALSTERTWFDLHFTSDYTLYNLLCDE